MSTGLKYLTLDTHPPPPTHTHTHHTQLKLTSKRSHKKKLVPAQGMGAGEVSRSEMGERTAEGAAGKDSGEVSKARLLPRAIRVMLCVCVRLWGRGGGGGGDCVCE